MKKVVVYGNCQSVALTKTLNEIAEFRERFSLVLLPAVHNIKSQEQIDYLLSNVEDADVFIYQHVKNSNWPKELSTDYLTGFLTDSAVKISIPSLYFNGYFPHIDHMNNIQGPLNMVHDYVIAYSFIKGLSETYVYRMMQDSALFIRKRYLLNFLKNQSHHCDLEK